MWSDASHALVGYILRHWRVWCPLLLGYAASLGCPMRKEAGASLPQRPPPVVFAIVWPILYLCIGYSWHRAASLVEADALHGALVALLSLWIVAYACADSPTAALYILAAALATTVCCMATHHSNGAKISLTPLLGWLLVAYQLNWHVIG